MSSRGQQRLEKGRLLSAATQACPEGASSTCCEEKLTPHSSRGRGVLHHTISGVPFTGYRCISTSQRVHLDFLTLQ